LSNSSIEKSNSQLTYDEPDDVKYSLSPEQIKDLLSELNSEMKKAALNLDFEQAAKLRDRIFELEQML
jgi:excinuclease ABC subunit B